MTDDIPETRGPRYGLELATNHSGRTRWIDKLALIALGAAVALFGALLVGLGEHDVEPGARGRQSNGSACVGLLGHRDRRRIVPRQRGSSTRPLRPPFIVGLHRSIARLEDGTRIASRGPSSECDMEDWLIEEPRA